MKISKQLKKNKNFLIVLLLAIVATGAVAYVVSLQNTNTQGIGLPVNSETPLGVTVKYIPTNQVGKLTLTGNLG